jgi:hypothetical protein
MKEECLRACTQTLEAFSVGLWLLDCTGVVCLSPAHGSYLCVCTHTRGARRTAASCALLGNCVRWWYELVDPLHSIISSASVGRNL